MCLAVPSDSLRRGRLCPRRGDDPAGVGGPGRRVVPGVVATVGGHEHATLVGARYFVGKFFDWNDVPCPLLPAFGQNVASCAKVGLPSFGCRCATNAKCRR